MNPQDIEAVPAAEPALPDEIVVHDAVVAPDEIAVVDEPVAAGEAAALDEAATAEDDPVSGEAVAPAPEREPLDLALVKRVLEAALLSTPDPLTLAQLKRLFAGELDIESLRKILDELKEEWAGRSVELTAVASGWRFRVKPDYQKYLDRITNEKPPRYSRAVLETLAIIAYRQPVTRGDIEDIRGVAVSPPTLKALEERGWIDEIGHRETPGRPALFATTRKFLDDLNLLSLEELPALEELQSALDATLESAPAFPAQEPLLAAEDADTEAEAGAEVEAATPLPDAGANAPSQDTEQTDHAG